jgi:hypothetical protein
MTPSNDRIFDSRKRSRASKVFGTLADMSLESNESGKPVLAAEDLRPIELTNREQDAEDKLTLRFM